MHDADAIRRRLRDLLYERKISQSQLCARLSQITGEEWLLQRLGKLLNGRIRLRVEDLVWIARAADLSLVELVREPGKEFVADLTPSELRLVDALRANPELTAVLTTFLTARTPARPVPHAIMKDRMRRRE